MSDLEFSDRGRSLIGQKMFSILDQAKKYEKEGRKIKHLELGEPDQYSPGRIVNKTIGSLLDYKVGYAPSGGLESLREKIADYFTHKYPREISFQNVVISPANLLIYQALEIVSNQEDRVCIFTPGFPTYFAVAKYMLADLKEVPLNDTDGFQLKIEDIDQAISLNPKVIIVNSGNNPTGAVYSEKALKYLVEKASENNIWLISDETYGMLSFNKPFFSLLNFNYRRIIVLSSFSKIFSVPGYRVGYAIADSEIIEKLVLSSSTLYSCLPIFTQEGILEGVGIIDEFTEMMRRKYKKISLDCIEIIGSEKRLICRPPDSAFYLFIDIRKLEIDDLSFCSKLLEKYGTALTPGSSFGRSGFVRASFCKDFSQVREGLMDLIAFSKEF